MIEVQEEEIVGNVLRRIFSEMFTAPFVQPPLQSEEGTEVGVYIVVKNKMLYYWYVHLS